MCKVRRSLLLFFLGSLAFIGRAQSVEQWTTWGDAASARGEPYGASRFYAGALELDPGRMSLQWKQAEACRLSNQYPQAAELYDRVYRKDMGRSHPEALRWLAEMLMCDGQYTEAERNWNKTLQKEKDKSSDIAERARNGIAGCKLAAAQDTASSSASLEHLQQPINTYDSEFGARFGPDSTLWFSSLRGEVNADGEVQDTAAYHVGIYSAKRSGDGWMDPMQEQGPPDAMGLGLEHANLVWTADGERMYFTQLSTDGTRSIATRLPTGPSEPITGLDATGNTTQPWVATIDGKLVLFFASDREGGSGSMDIWMGDLADNAITNVRNAGPMINTLGNETCPSFDENDSTFWFSSDFHPGLGGYDIFRTIWNNGVLDPPMNAGAPINSSANDLYPAFNAATGDGWITSNRKGSFAAKGETCCNDLYRLRSPSRPSVKHVPPAPRDTTATAQATIAQFQVQFPLTLYFHNDEPDPRSWATTTAQDYSATFSKYRALFTTYQKEQQDTTAFNAFIRNDVERGNRRLDELVKALLPILQSGEEITLEVRGHASPLAKSDYNKNLSLRRIETLRNQFRSAENGAFIPFLDSTATNGGRLRIEELPFGEDRSAQGISDDVHDPTRSVFSMGAARERRIEVERIVFSPRAVDSEVDFRIGTVQQGREKVFHFPIRNTTTVPLTIRSTQAECDCTIGRASKEPIPPGGTGELEVIFTGRARPGPLERRIIVTTDGDPERITLRVLGTVEE